MNQAEAELYKEVEPIIVVVSRKNVEAGNIGPTLENLQSFSESPEKIRILREKVEICFAGYDDSPQELHEIPAVRGFVAKLDKEFPYWLYFLSKHFTGLQCIIHCFLPPEITPEAHANMHSAKLRELLERWFEAMNLMIEKARLSEELNEHMTDKVVSYIAYGPIPMDSQNE